MVSCWSDQGYKGKKRLIRMGGGGGGGRGEGGGRRGSGGTKSEKLRERNI